MAWAIPEGLTRMWTDAKPVANELLLDEWDTLAQLWSVAKRANPAPDPADATVIEALFAAAHVGGDATGWTKFNEAEKRVGTYLTPAQLAMEYDTLLQLATDSALPGLTTFKGYRPLFVEEAKLEVQRAAYAALLHALQSSFIQGRFERRLRGEVATRLFRYGLIVLALAAVAPLLLVLNRLAPVASVDHAKLVSNQPITLTRFSSEPLFALSLVASFGILGAFFSRAIAFQTSIGRVTFDGVQQLYVGRVLRMRLLYGVIGALVFYFVIRSGLIGGKIFPDLNAIGIGEHAVWRMGPDGPVRLARSGRLEPAGLTILEPTMDMAKLLVWSFLAGFSERLVPDTLARTEAQFESKKTG